MIKSIELFNSCVAAYRMAEKAFEENPTPFNKEIMLDLQKIVDVWLEWIEKRENAETFEGFQSKDGDAVPVMGYIPSDEELERGPF